MPIFHIPALTSILLPDLRLRILPVLHPKGNLPVHRILSLCHTNHKNIIYVPEIAVKILDIVHKIQTIPAGDNMLCPFLYPHFYLFYFFKLTQTIKSPIVLLLFNHQNLLVPFHCPFLQNRTFYIIASPCLLLQAKCPVFP